MRTNDVLGIIFSNTNTDFLKELTAERTLGSVPFGGRYRMIDFGLSNMSNSGINKVAVIANRKYQSLINHLGSGKPWDLSRRRDGLFILPTFGKEKGDFNNKVDMLFSILAFIKKSKEKYVILSDCDTICNISYREILWQHVLNNADITLIYKKSMLDINIKNNIVLEIEKDFRINGILISPKMQANCNLFLNISIFKKDLLCELIENAISKNKTDFIKNLLQDNIKKLKIYGYEFKGFCGVINSMLSYFACNMSLLNSEIKNELFSTDLPIYTKVIDDMPAKYGLNADIKNCLVGNGCIIDGKLNNSIIFKGVKIGKNSIINNSIIMADATIAENCKLEHIICDKDVTITSQTNLKGTFNLPIFINKDTKI